jgi:hypothetical protein
VYLNVVDVYAVLAVGCSTRTSEAKYLEFCADDVRHDVVVGLEVVVDG